MFLSEVKARQGELTADSLQLTASVGYGIRNTPERLAVSRKPIADSVETMMTADSLPLEACGPRITATQQAIPGAPRQETWAEFTAWPRGCLARTGSEMARPAACPQFYVRLYLMYKPTDSESVPSQLSV